MKICIIATHYLPHIGGLELATYHLAHQLTTLGHEVHVITPQDSASAEKNPDKIIVHRIPILGYPNGLPALVFLKGLVFFKRAMQCIEEIDPDIIHSQNITNSVPAHIAGKKRNIPYVICIHGNLELMGPFLPPILKKRWPKLPYIKNADKIIVLTKDMASTIKTQLGTTPEVIPNGVDTDRFYPNITPNISLKNPNIICLSRIDDKKGLEYAIESMTIVQKLHPNTKMNIVGDGEYREKLERLVDKYQLNDTVRFTGLVQNREVPSILRSADIFLLPSLYEGLPLSLLEAMACGLPIISTPVSIVPEIIAEWKNGIMVPFKSPEKIADAILTLINNSNMRLECSTQSSKAARESHSWTLIAKKYEKLYHEIITSK